MQRYSREIVSQVLAANDIVEVVGAYVNLQPAGGNRLKGLSPFSNEKTPSFMVHRDRQMFHCFSTDQGGDAIGFLMKHEGLTFVEALRKLADRAGITLPALRGGGEKAEQRRTQLLEFGKFAARCYREMLEHPLRGSVGRKYLQTRQLNEATIRRFGLGYVPEGYTNLLDAARQKGVSREVLQDCGLFREGRQGGLYDFFRNRVMFPIQDVSGNVVAFGGRALDDSPAKYINSPESTVYKKSRVLYGLHEARDTLRRAKEAILVEGYFDVLRCFDAGIENVVATCGTALTPEHASLIRRYVPEVVVVYDGDAAGIKAALRGASVLTGAGLTVRALALPEGQDPDDYVRDHGADAFRSLVAEAPDVVSFYVRMSAHRTERIEGRVEVAHEVFELLEGIGDALRTDEYLKKLALELGLNTHLCESEFQRFLQREQGRRTLAAPKEEKGPPRLRDDDVLFVAALLEDAELRAEAEAALETLELEPGPLAAVLHGLAEASETDGRFMQDDPDAQRLYAAAATREWDGPEDRADLVRKRITAMRRGALQARAEELKASIMEAERGQDMARKAELLAQHLKLRRELEQIGAA